MGSAAKFGLLILMGLVIALARFLEGEVRPKKNLIPTMALSSKFSKPKTKPPYIAPPNTDPAPQVSPAPGPNVEPVTPAPAPAGRTYKVRKRDTLGKISRKVYGKSSLWKVILAANQTALKGNAKRLKPGMVLNIPKRPQ